jgi:hypothetical protein
MPIIKNTIDDKMRGVIIINIINIAFIIYITCRSQWPRGLRRRSAAARLLRSWVRIPPEAWTFVCCECCVLSGRGFCDELITHPEESYRLWCVVVCDLETSRIRRPWPALGRSATGIYIYIYIYYLPKGSHDLRTNEILVQIFCTCSNNFPSHLYMACPPTPAYACKVVPSRYFSQLKFCKWIYFLPCFLHSPLKSNFYMWSPESYVMISIYSYNVFLITSIQFLSASGISVALIITKYLSVYKNLDCLSAQSAGPSGRAV